MVGGLEARPTTEQGPSSPQKIAWWTTVRECERSHLESSGFATPLPRSTVSIQRRSSAGRKWREAGNGVAGGLPKGGWN